MRRALLPMPLRKGLGLPRPAAPHGLGTRFCSRLFSESLTRRELGYFLSFTSEDRIVAR